jgi:hypothetical protein
MMEWPLNVADRKILFDMGTALTTWDGEVALTTLHDDGGEVFPWLFKVHGLQLICQIILGRWQYPSTPPLPPTKPALQTKITNIVTNILAHR